MVNLQFIYEGWTKKLGLVEVSEEDKEMAKARLAICVVCPHAKEQWLTSFIDDILQKDELGSGIGCKLCGCPINAKALVKKEKCPDNRW